MDKQTRWMLACLVLLCAAVYWPVAHYGPIDYDDNQYVFKNPHVLAGFSPAGMRYAFTTFTMGNWNPLLWISFYTDRLVLHLHPSLMHLENVVLHLVGGLMLWRLLYVCTGKIRPAFVVAGLFLCHPMHVESVAWISERKDVLSTPLLFAAMLAYVGYCQAIKENTFRRKSAWIPYGCMIVFYTLSLMTKPMGVSLPAVLLLLDYWPLERWPDRSAMKRVVEKLPLFLISAAAMWLATHSQGVTGARASLTEVTLPVRLENAVVSYAIYISKLAVPTHLAVFYGRLVDQPIGSVVAAGGLLILISIVFYRFRWTSPWLLMGWLWFLGTLVPVIGLVQVGSQSMADRYSYFPSIGLFIAAVWGVGRIIPRILSPHPSARMQGYICASLLLVYTVAAHHQVKYWKNTDVMFTHALEVAPDNSIPHDQLGGLALDRNDLATAFREYARACDLSPDPVAFDGLGICYLHVDFSKAIEYFRFAVKLAPDSAVYHSHLATALRRHGDLVEARKEAQTAIRLDPDFLEAQQELVTINSQPGQKKP